MNTVALRAGLVTEQVSSMLLIPKLNLYFRFLAARHHSEQCCDHGTNTIRADRCGTFIARRVVQWITSSAVARPLHVRLVLVLQMHYLQDIHTYGEETSHFGLLSPQGQS